MKAIQFEMAGPVEVLRYTDMPTPQPGPGQVLIKTAAISVNFVDTLIRQGHYPAPVLPHIPGCECSGTVEAVGAQVAGLAPGDPVVLFGAHLHQKCYAEHVVADASVVTAVPTGVGLDEAAALPAVYLTAYHMLHTMAHIQRGQTVLLHAAAGGVGMAAAQLAKLGGARVIGLSSSPEKVQFAAAQGCDHVINYKSEDVRARVREITGGRGADAILNAVAGSSLGRDFEMLAPLGQIIWYGMAAGPPQDDLTQKLAAGFGTSLGLRTFAIYSVHALGPEVMNRSLTAMLQLLAEKKIAPHIHARVPLAEAAQAHQMLESGKVMGKVILKP